MRTLKKEWRNARYGWNRRAQWFDNGMNSFRLKLMDEHTELNLFFTSREACASAYKMFVELAMTEQPLQPGQQPLTRRVKEEHGVPD